VLVWLLAGVAAARVLVFCAAFPFFNNVDEQAHFDVVIRYSRGQLPRGLGPCLKESAEYMALYGTPEYFFGPETFPGGRIPPPLWTHAGDELGPGRGYRTAQEQSVINHEAAQAPLYYAVAGLWLHLGRASGFSGGFLLYWIRFLNAFLAATLVWLGYSAARLMFPERGLLRLGMPLLLAVYPQDMYYSIQSDVLSPLLFGVAFIGLVKWLRPDPPGVRWAVLTGLALAGTGLTKVTNLPLLAVAAAVLLWRAWRLAKAGGLRPALPALGWR